MPFGLAINDLAAVVEDCVSCPPLIGLTILFFAVALGNVVERLLRGVDGECDPARGFTRPLCSGLFKPFPMDVVDVSALEDVVGTLELFGRAMPDEGGRSPDCFGPIKMKKLKKRSENIIYVIHVDNFSY